MRASVSFCVFPSASLHCLDKRVALCGGAALLVLGAALSPIASAQTASAPHLDTSGNLKSEMAACAERRTPQARKLCIAEARTAETARRTGKLDNYGGHFEANALKRCEVFKAADDRAACRARVEKGTTDDSVIEGGVLRELTVTVKPSADTDATRMHMPAMPAMPTPMPSMPSEPMPMPAPMPMPSMPQ